MSVLAKRIPQFDISKYRYVASTATLLNEGLNCLWVKPDGTKIFYMGTTAGILRSYDMSSPWDIRTITNPLSSSQRLVNTGSIDIAPRSMAFNSIGNTLLVAASGTFDNCLLKYDLSIPWNVTSISITASQQTYNEYVTGNVSSIWLGNNDTILSLQKNINASPSLFVNTISASLDLNTIILDNTGSYAGVNLPSFNFIDNGNKFILATGAAGAGTGNFTIYQLNSPYKITLNSNNKIVDTNLIAGQQITSFFGGNGLGETWMSNDGNYLYVISANAAILKIHMFST